MSWRIVQKKRGLMQRKKLSLSKSITDNGGPVKSGNNKRLARCVDYMLL